MHEKEALGDCTLGTHVIRRICKIRAHNWSSQREKKRKINKKGTHKETEKERKRKRKRKREREREKEKKKEKDREKVKVKERERKR